MKSVVLVDDHPVVAVGLRLAFQQSRQFELIAVLANPADCVARINACRPDALIIDLVFDGVVHGDLVAQCRAVLPAAAIVVFSSLPELQYAPQAIAAGADAYLSKSSDLSVMSQLLADVIWPPAGPSLPGGEAAGRREPKTSQHTQPFVYDGVHLTQREIEIARYVGRGLSIGIIARELGISANTAAAHRENIRKKLNCRDTKDLVARLARMERLGDARE